MLIQIKIKLTSHYLGSKKDTTKDIRRLRVSRGNLVQLPYWKESLSEAVKSLMLSIDVSSISWGEGIRLPSLHLYKRRYNRNQIDFFESMRKGTELTFRYYMHDEIVESRIGEHRFMWEHVGKYIGLSEFGKKFGYGRFEVLELKKVTYGIETEEY